MKVYDSENRIIPVVCIDLEKNPEWKPLEGAANAAPAFTGILPISETSSASASLWMRNLYGDDRLLAALMPILVVRIGGHEFTLAVRQTGKTTMKAIGFLGDSAVEVQLKKLVRTHCGRDETFVRCIVGFIEPSGDCGLWEAPEVSLERMEQDADMFFPE
jgi:hypothetical protein